MVHRASLLRELVALLPQEILHTNKRLSTISQDASHVEVVFQDDTKENFDVVIGADGIFSSVRPFVLEDPENQLGSSPAGFWDSRVLIDRLDSSSFPHGFVEGWA